MVILTPTGVAIELDAVIKRTYRADVEVTKLAIERGGKIADNASSQPIEIEIEGIVTDADVPGSSTTVYQQFNDLREKLVTVVAGYDSYDDMALTSLKIPEDDKTGESIKVEATFRQIKQVTLQQTTVATRSGGKKSKGAQSTTPATTSPALPPRNQGLYRKHPGARAVLTQSGG